MNVFQFFNQIDVLNDPKYLIPMLIWIIIWKGLALWKASQRKEVLWFWLLMIINTLGLLEICYIFVFSRNKEDFKFLKNISIRKNKKENEIEEKQDEDVLEEVEEKNDKNNQ